MSDVDNTAALSAVVKGRGREPVNRHLAALFWMFNFHLRARIWLEYVDPDSNWSDGISRLYGKDDFAARHGFSTCRFDFQPAWMHLSYMMLWLRTERVTR